MSNRILLIGWDGADWQHITPLLDEGLLPGLESLVNRGVMGNLATLQPILSPMLWNSIATGKTADKHGIHGFVEPLPDFSGVRPVTSTSRKSKALWNIFNQNGWRSNVIGWWASFPAEPINGHIVTNLFNAIRRDENAQPIVGPHVIHPQSLAQELADFKVDITEITENDIGPFCPNYTNVDQDKDRRLVTLAKLISDCASIQSVTTALMERDDWDFTAVYFDSIDHFCHAFMPYHPPQMPNINDADFEIYKDVIRGAYQLSDMMLQRLVQLAGDETTIVLCSDHGFQSGRGRPLVTPLEPAGPALWHRSHGILVMAGAGIKQDQRVYGANIIDIAPTILHLAGLPVGEDMDGRVLLDAFVEPQEPRFIESWDRSEGDCGMHPVGFEIFENSDEKQDDLIKQFVALGYIEDPGENSVQAATNAATELKYNLARVFYSTNRFEQALPLFQELVHESPWEDRFWKNLAYCCYELNYFEPAEQIIKKLYQDSKNIPPFSKLILAQCAWENSDRELAHHYVDQLLAGKHRVANVYGSLGMLLVSRIRDLDKAKLAFETCKAVDPDYALAYEGLAGIYYRSKQYEKCIDEALNAVALVYRLPKAHYYLGLALEKTGDVDHAIIAFNRVKNFNYRKYAILAIKKLLFLYEFKRELAKADRLRIELQRLRQTVKSRDRKIETVFDLPEMPSATARKEIANSRRKTNNQKSESSGKTFLLVSGLPRSGTSLMMQMLDAGGIHPQTDGIRVADENNPRGYYEWEAIKKIGQHPEILDAPAIEDKAIKVISMLIPALPKNHQYKIIFMMRPIHQIVASQSKMIDRLGTDGSEIEPDKIAARLERHRSQILQLLENQENFELIDVDYETLLKDTENQIARIIEFIDDQRLDADQMPNAIEHHLHREK